MLKGISVATVLIVLAGSVGWYLNAGAGPSAPVNLGDGTRMAFVASSTAPEIAAIDIRERTLAAELSVPHIAGDIAVSDTYGLLFATDIGGKSVSIIFLPTGEYALTNQLGLTPDVMLLNSTGRFIAFGGREGIISVWDVQENREVQRIEGLEPVANLTFNRDSTRLYSVEAQNMRVAVIDLLDGRVTDHIPLPGTPGPGAEVSGLSRSLDGGTGFVSVTSEDRLAILDLTDNSFYSDVPLPDDPGRPYATTDGRLILVPHGGGEAVTVLSRETLQPLRTIAVGSPVADVRSAWLDTVAFAIPEDGSDVAVLDLTSLKKKTVIGLTGVPGGGLVTADHRYFLTAESEAQSVALIDARSLTLADRIKTPLKGLSAPSMAATNNICH